MVGAVSEVLTAIDVVRVQDAVFASNRLRDVVSGSRLVRAITEEDHLTRFGAEQVVFGGGGNALVRSENLDVARTFVVAYSRALLDEAPGVEIVVAHQAIAGNELGSLDALQRKLDAAKLNGRVSLAERGLAVTAICSETQTLATQLVRDLTPGSERLVPVSASVARRRAGYSTNLDRVPSNQQGSGFECFLPNQLDQVAAATNRLALVHIDGTRVGARIRSAIGCAQACSNSPLDRLKEIATELDGLMKSTERTVVQLVRDCARTGRDGRPAVVSVRSGIEIPLAQLDRGWALPIRPLVCAGDDMTFVCDGRLGLTLAQAALQHLAATPVAALEEKPLDACAGIAIAHRGIPMAHLFRTAERACRNAKAWAAGTGGVGYALDWYVGDPLDQANRAHRQRRVAGCRLTAKPYRLSQQAPATTSGFPASWEELDERVLGPNPTKSGYGAGILAPEWQQHRGRLNALQSASHRGAGAATALLDRWGITDAEPWLQNGGFDRGRAQNPLLDALELAESHAPLTKAGP